MNILFAFQLLLAQIKDTLASAEGLSPVSGQRDETKLKAFGVFFGGGEGCYWFGEDHLKPHTGKLSITAHGQISYIFESKQKGDGGSKVESGDFRSSNE